MVRISIVVLLLWRRVDFRSPERLYLPVPGERGARPEGDVAGEYTTSRRLVGTVMVATVAVALVTLAMA
jgi:hypothetical protein